MRNHRVVVWASVAVWVGLTMVELVLGQQEAFELFLWTALFAAAFVTNVFGLWHALKIRSAVVNDHATDDEADVAHGYVRRELFRLLISLSLLSVGVAAALHIEHVIIPAFFAAALAIFDSSIIDYLDRRARFRRYLRRQK